ncbi:MAG TPA: glycoside hydrolase family 32 protein [Candidatus Ventrimonas merdavium]|nr:glycoside hydrolase family 32 protein [Candidatus Ventrimonas merdavium]
MGGTVASCPFRTRFHIMPPVGWLNDPNGLCQFRGVFHAYFQYSPLNVHGGGGYWGHCVSRDLLTWDYQEPVLAADTEEDKSGVYSGSALVEDGRMYLFYTGNVKQPGDYDYIDAGRISTQLLVESEDGQAMSAKEKLLGMEDYPEDVTQHVRDPKVWKENGAYHMILGARFRAWDGEGRRRDQGGALLYVSPDKHHWRLEGELTSQKDFGYMWECPDLFSLEGRRVLSFCPQGLASEPERFQNLYQSGYSLLEEGADPEDTFVEWDMGFDFYAPQTFEADDGRRILIGWSGMPDMEQSHRNLSVEHGWQHCLTLPAELVFREGRIFRMPVRELDELGWEPAEAEQGMYRWENKAVKLRMWEIGGEEQEIRIGAGENALVIHVSQDRTELSFRMPDGRIAPCGGGRDRRVGRAGKPVEQLLVLVDSSIAEVFVNDGELVFTTRIYLEPEERELWVKGTGKWKLEVI